MAYRHIRQEGDGIVTARAESTSKRRSPGKKDQGAVPLRVGFEEHLPHFPPVALKAYLVILLRTIFWDSVQMPTATLARIIEADEGSVAKALTWLENPSTRSSEKARTLPAYIRRTQEPEHEHTQRKVQVITVEKWIMPATYWRRLQTNAKGGKRENAALTRPPREPLPWDEGESDAPPADQTPGEKAAHRPPALQTRTG